MDSNLGIETMSRGNKTLGILFPVKIKKNIDPFFGKIEYDLHTLTSYSKFENKLNFMIKQNKKKLTLINYFTSTKIIKF